MSDDALTQDGAPVCWKCEKTVQPDEVYVAIVWWVGYQTPQKTKTLLEEVVYRYCFKCAQEMDFENVRLFDVEHPHFQLDGAVDLPNPTVLARCERCKADILSGRAYAILHALLRCSHDGRDVDIADVASWRYCEQCAPRMDVENLFVLESERPVDLLQLAKAREA